MTYISVMSYHVKYISMYYIKYICIHYDIHICNVKYICMYTGKHRYISCYNINIFYCPKTWQWDQIQVLQPLVFVGTHVCRTTDYSPLNRSKFCWQSELWQDNDNLHTRLYYWTNLVFLDWSLILMIFR